MTTYLEEEARNFTIREAMRLETQALAMSGDASNHKDQASVMAARIKSLIEESEKVMSLAIDRIEAWKANEENMRAEAEKLATIRRQLEADRAAGKPFPIIITTT